MSGNPPALRPEPARGTDQCANACVSVLLAFLASRLVVFSTVYLSRLEVLPGPLTKPVGFMNALTGGEAGAILDLVRNGRIAGVQDLAPIGGFPVFPALLKIVSLAVPNLALSGLLVSNLSLLGAGWLFWKLLAAEYNEAAVSRAGVMLLMFSPAAYFFSAATPDATFLALSIACALAAHQSRWLLAALAAAALCFTISFGWCIAFLLAAESVRAARSRDDGTLVSALPLVTVITCVLVQLNIGHTQANDWLLFFHRNAQWQSEFENLVRISSTFASYRTFYDFLFAIAVIAAAAICVAALWRGRGSWISYAIALSALCLLAHDMQAMRTLSVAFPFYAICAACVGRNSVAYDLTLAGSIALGAVCTIIAANGFWIG
jgi:hypothetical protein